ncbi:unnamed protein product, partial [Amoebophrya sp. A25]
LDPEHYPNARRVYRRAGERTARGGVRSLKGVWLQGPAAPRRCSPRGGAPSRNWRAGGRRWRCLGRLKSSRTTLTRGRTYCPRGRALLCCFLLPRYGTPRRRGSGRARGPIWSTGWIRFARCRLGC